jgi:putative dimethyl sulfoxide reductase chaperone
MMPHSPMPVAVEPSPRIKSSIFGNYHRANREPEPDAADSATPSAAPAATTTDCAELALARSFLHQMLARSFEYPTADTWHWLCRPETQAACLAACQALDPGTPSALTARGQDLAAAFQSNAFDAFHDDYLTAIGHAARGSCPINEIEYGDLKADPLFQPHRLADLAAFYHAFGLEVCSSAGERQDHLSVEFEFMSVLTAQEAHALNTRPAPEAAVICREAQRKFLREHLGRWTPAFTRRLYRDVGDRALGALAQFALAFVQCECRRLGVSAGSEDLLLRPADEGAALCSGCGLEASPPR